MNRLLRYALTCLLLVAVPLQGYAAGGMLFCGIGAGQPSGAGSPHEHAHVDDQGAADHDHATGEDAGIDDTSTMHRVTHGTCSACSACCSAVALPNPTLTSGGDSPRSLPVVERESASAGPGASRLDRPPRLILA